MADDDIILGAGSNPGDVTADGILTLDAGHSVEVADGGSIKLFELLDNCALFAGEARRFFKKKYPCRHGLP